jgi:hypothetical protein
MLTRAVPGKWASKGAGGYYVSTRNRRRDHSLALETKEVEMAGFEDIREQMEVIGADGVRVGTVDRIEGDKIKLTKSEGFGEHQGHHHFISRGLVAEVEGDKVRLSANADVAVQFEEEESGS